jgi:hypothetical protein
MRVFNYLFATTLATCLLSGCTSSNEKSGPKITSIEPDSAQVGDPVVIKGEFLGTTKSIHFDTTSALVIDAQASQVTTQVPAGLIEGTKEIVIENDQSTSNKFQFIVLPTTPVDPDPLPTDPAINNIVPAISYKGYPIMLRGKNFLNVNKVMFNTTEAKIITVYNETVTVFVPTLTNGAYTIKAITSEGASSKGITFNVASAPAGFPAPPSATFISPPPANFSAVISNQWSIFSLGEGGKGQCQLIDFSDDKFCGSYKFERDSKTKKVTSNYIEFTRDGVEHFYGQWSSKFEIPCEQKIVFISGKTGKVLNATVDVSFTDNCKK